MTTLRLYFLSSYLGLGAVWPLLGLAFAARGFSASQYAWLLALLPLSRLLGSPLWGALADTRFGSTRLVRINSWLTALGMLALACFDDPSTTAVAFALWALCSSSLTPLVEASTYVLLGTRAAGFGYVRVFGSIGFAVSALGASALALDPRGAGPFALAAVGYAAAGLVSQRLPLVQATPRAIGHALRGIPLRADLLLLWIASTLYAAAHGLFDVYFGPYVRSLPGLPIELVGSAWGIGVVFEIALVWYMPRLLSSRATRWILPASALIAMLRWWLLSEVESALHLLLLAPLHAITFGAFYLSFVHESQLAAEPELRATMQGIAAACQGLGVITATVLGGYAFERWGGRCLYQLAAAGAFAAFSLYALRLFVLRRAPLSQSTLSGQA